VLAGDHVSVCLPGTHHRINAGIRIDHDLEEGSAVETDEFTDDARHVGFVIEPRSVFEAVGQRRLDEILGVQALVAGAQAAAVEQLLEARPL